MSGSVTCTRLHDGAAVRLVLDAPPGNILDGAMLAALRTVLHGLRGESRLKAIVLEGRGAHFSYGTSIEEHRPEKVAAMLAAFHGVFRALLDLDRVLVAAVRGRCLGGGMELACFCDRVIASPDAAFAQPEIALGAFAPVASVHLARRAGTGRAGDICLTGRTLAAAEALAAGVADEVADDPPAAAEAWIARHLLPRSAAALARAVRALRLPWRDAFLRDVAEAERLYRDDLARTADAAEGVEAFLNHRRPVWKDE